MKSYKKIFLLGIALTVILTLVLSSSAMSLEVFFNQYAGTADVLNTRLTLLKEIYINNPDLLIKELEYEKGISQLLNLH